jgi:hypothetical protein
MKKLYVNFTDKEKELLKSILNNRKNKDVEIIPHAKKRMIEKYITSKDVSDALKDFNIIELHQKGWDTRILARGKAKDRFPLLMKAYDQFTKAGLKVFYYLTQVPKEEQVKKPGIV